MHVQYCDVMRFMVLHKRHHKVSRSSCNTTVTILLRIRVRGHLVMSNANYRESHYLTVVDNPLDNKSNKPISRIDALKGNIELKCNIFQWCYHTY